VDYSITDGLFMTYGGGTRFTSPDGTNWNLKRLDYGCPPMNNYGKKGGGGIYGNGLLVTVMSHGRIYTSTDEKNNKQSYKQNSGTSDDLNYVTYGNGLFVVVGGNSGTWFTSSSGTILTSPDGTTWTKRNSGTSDDLWGVTYENGLFVTVGSNGIILTSPDGTTWTKRNSGTSDDLYGVTSYSQ
jgi:predicted outer membrane repeat protein